ncbi:MAG: pilus assembly protein PilM [Verrucomicrobiae bacterium]|nr:pilus assembly protein PilM [Verrucomicrobiae bacterium]MDW8308162.1 pilus assembly protein PilM [Verrucomicrobiales bacterium]
MALPFLDRTGRRKRDQLLAFDLGARTTKAVSLSRHNGGFALHRYAVMDAPIYEKTLSTDLLAEHLRALVQQLDARTRMAVFAVGVGDALVRHAELPRIPLEDMRQILKINSKNYLQQDLPNHVFDCYVMAAAHAAAKPAEPAKTAPAAGPAKQKVLVAGAKRQLVDDFVAAARHAGLVADHIVPGLIGPINAFEAALPEAFAREVVALVDLGFRHSTICILAEGELVLSRTVAIGGDRLTSGLAEAMNITYAEAEGIKVGMPAEVQSTLETLLVPLGRELRASIDFFEHQQERPVSAVYLTGGASRSEFIVQVLQNELMVECRPWNPTSFLRSELPPVQAAELEQIAPQLAVAIGAALAAF